MGSNIFDSHPSSANAVVIGEKDVELVLCGPPCGNVIRGGIVLGKFG